MRKEERGSRGPHFARSVATSTVAFSLFLAPANAGLLDGARVKR